MSRAQRALDAWSGIVENQMSDLGIRYLQSFNQGLRETAQETGGFAYADDDQVIMATMSTLAHADIFAVSSDIMAVVNSVAPTCPWHPVLLGDEMPSQYGFVWFEEPLDTRDVYGKRLRLYAVTWHPTAIGFTDILDGAVEDGFQAPGMVLTFYTRADDLLDDYSREIAEDPRAAQVDAAMPTPWRLSLIQYYPADQTAIPETHRAKLAGQVHFESEESWVDERNIIRWMVSLWLVIKERMTTVTEVDAPRAARRRAQRQLPSAQISRIKVVDLSPKVRRMSEDRPDNGGGNRYSHRFRVRAHWRHQPHGPGRQLRRLQLINTYIKGPDDAPFIDKTTVFDVK